MRPIFLFAILMLAGASFATSDPVAAKLAAAAEERTKSKVTYDSSYYRISYPNGDVPADRGVCTDVVIRSYRKLGIDLQREVHEDMAKHFKLYPKIFGLKGPDTNIDHRRVPNLITFFTRKGAALPITDKSEDYQPGDLVTWMLPTGQGHIGVVTHQKNFWRTRYQIVHNIGAGDVMEDVLFDWKITGHFRYLPRG